MRTCFNTADRLYRNKNKLRLPYDTEVQNLLSLGVFSPNNYKTSKAVDLVTHAHLKCSASYTQDFALQCYMRVLGLVVSMYDCGPRGPRFDSRVVPTKIYIRIFYQKILSTSSLFGNWRCFTPVHRRAR